MRVQNTNMDEWPRLRCSLRRSTSISSVSSSAVARRSVAAARVVSAISASSEKRVMSVVMIVDTTADRRGRWRRAGTRTCQQDLARDSRRATRVPAHANGVEPVTTMARKVGDESASETCQVPNGSVGHFVVGDDLSHHSGGCKLARSHWHRRAGRSRANHGSPNSARAEFARTRLPDAHTGQMATERVGRPGPFLVAPFFFEAPLMALMRAIREREMATQLGRPPLPDAHVGARQERRRPSLNSDASPDARRSAWSNSARAECTQRDRSTGGRRQVGAPADMLRGSRRPTSMRTRSPSSVRARRPTSRVNSPRAQFARALVPMRPIRARVDDASPNSPCAEFARSRWPDARSGPPGSRLARPRLSEAHFPEAPLARKRPRASQLGPRRVRAHAHVHRRQAPGRRTRGHAARQSSPDFNADTFPQLRPRTAANLARELAARPVRAHIGTDAPDPRARGRRQPQLALRRVRAQPVARRALRTAGLSPGASASSVRPVSRGAAGAARGPTRRAPSSRAHRYRCARSARTWTPPAPTRCAPSSRRRWQ